MKKTIVVILFVCIISIGVIYYFSSGQERGQDTDIRTLFTRWDREEVEDSEKMSTMNALADSLRGKPQFSIQEVDAISNFISVFEAGFLRVIQYIENPEFYGSSGKESFHLVVYNDLAEIIDSRGSIRIEEIKKRAEHLYYVYATDYKVSNMTGLRIFKIEIDDERAINLDSLVNKERLTDNFRYDEASEVLYYNDGHLYYKEIRDNGSEVLITVGDTDYLLQMDEDELYHVSPIR